MDVLTVDNLIAIALGILVAGMVGYYLLFRNPNQSAHLTVQEATFAFANDDLIDATDAASALLSEFGPPDGTDWGRFLACFSARFPELVDLSLCAIDENTVLSAADTEDTGRLILRKTRKWVRITLTDSGLNALQAQRARLLEKECRQRLIQLATAPNPIWESDTDGNVTYANPAYLALAPNHERATVPKVFDLNLQPTDSPHTVRVQVPHDDADDDPNWFDIRSIYLTGKWMHYGTDVRQIVQAEMAQRNFVQTLTKTFAQLSIGLAVFDRNRQLALFNPALIDLTALPADFLSARPDLYSFFDRLRDKRMMPEPKNYADWRDKLTNLISEARNGLYQETWSLPSGLTYRISGRPHPDGAVAFLLEDISAEISLTRRFRSELEISQDVLDTQDEALAVFSAVGVMTSSNRAYEDLWKDAGAASFQEVDTIRATSLWQSKCRPTPIWGDLREFLIGQRDRVAWDAIIQLNDGARMICRAVPLSGGATMVGFRQVSDHVPAPLETSSETA